MATTRKIGGDKKLTDKLKATALPATKIDLANITPDQIALIRDDLVKAIVSRAKLDEAGDPHSSHGNVHSSNNSAGAI